MILDRLMLEKDKKLVKADDPEASNKQDDSGSSDVRER
jgi:hypothetical protein